MSEYQEDVTEDSSDLNDEIAESSAALDDEQEFDGQETDDEELGEESEQASEPKETEDTEIIRTFESDKANERFSKITAENRELKKRLDALESVPDYVDPGEPKEDDYPDYDSHQNALMSYQAEKSAHDVMSKRQQAVQEAAVQAERQSLYGEHDKKQKHLAESVSDLWQTLDQSLLNNQTPGGNLAAEFILRRDNSADIEYFIAKNPEIAVRLNSGNQFTVFDEVNRISESLRVTPKKGAALPKPVGASPSGGGRSSEHKAVFSAGATFE